MQQNMLVKVNSDLVKSPGGKSEEHVHDDEEQDNKNWVCVSGHKSNGREQEGGQCQGYRVVQQDFVSFRDASGE